MSKKLLVVDDSSAIRQSVSFILQQSGYETVLAEDGQDGLNKVQEQEFSMIITDVNMPNMDGITMITKIRENPKYKFMPIIVLTTESQEGKMQQGKAAGATGWIVKPFDATRLIAVVKKLIG